MKIIRSVSEMSEVSLRIRTSLKRSGFVPTMGYLHDGHLSLVRASKSECDITIVSIFVNPSQFCPGEDLEKYPRDIDRDISLLEKEGVDFLFAPDAGEMYPEGYSSYVDMDCALVKKLCGVSRPGHFRGVSTVVAKLFNITDPDNSYFGQKDIQQGLVIKRMASDLNFRTKIRIMPTVREPDGLAMSSRNKYLSCKERKLAAKIFKSLERASKEISSGEKSAANIRKIVEDFLSGEEGIKIDYVDVVDPEDLRSLERLNGNTLIVVAAFVGATRLIDNILVQAGN
ncbi:MAG: pantoate--beta-alanine ligase [Candidatus Omnitrophota bacterium]